MRSRVGLVTELHGGALLLGERRGPAVGQEVYEHVLRAKEERVVARLSHGDPPFVRRAELDRLNDLRLPGRW
jgi:hypothetical protein